MAEKDKPDFSKVQGGHRSRTEPAAPEPSFGRVSGGFASDSAAEPAPERSHTVQPGESLSAISREVYGNAKHWRLIYEANRDQIDNPDLIHIGQVLKIPPDPKPD